MNLDPLNGFNGVWIYLGIVAAFGLTGAVLGAASRITRWIRDRRQPATPPPERDALTELADIEQQFRAYAARIHHLYPRKENPQP